MAFDQTACALIEPTDAVRRDGPTAASLDRVVLIADFSNAYSSAAHAEPLVRDFPRLGPPAGIRVPASGMPMWSNTRSSVAMRCPP